MTTNTKPAPTKTYREVIDSIRHLAKSTDAYMVIASLDEFAHFDPTLVGEYLDGEHPHLLRAFYAALDGDRAECLREARLAATWRG